MTKLTLHFTSSPSVSLLTTQLILRRLGHELEAIRAARGRDAGPLRGYGTFPWSSAVQAFSLLAVVTRISVLEGRQYLVSESSLLGGRGSAASSLDMSISKRTNWILDIFGVESDGSPRANRVFQRMNPSRRRPGPTIISFNSRFLPFENIEIFSEGVAADAETLNGLHSALASKFNNESQSVNKGAYSTASTGDFIQNLHPEPRVIRSPLPQLSR